MSKPASDTPLTDAMLRPMFFKDGPRIDAPWEWVCPERDAGRIANHARKMERDRARLIEALQELHNAIRTTAMPAESVDMLPMAEARSLLSELSGGE